MVSDKACDYCFALCVVLLITFQFWYGTPHVSFYESSEETFKSHLYVGSSSMPSGWTIYMCGKERTNHMSYNVSVIENSRAWTRTIFGNASRMPIPTIAKSFSGGIVSYVLSKAQMENLANNPLIEQVYVEPLMHCLEPAKFCSKNTKQRKLVIDDVQCLAIANPNNYEVMVEFMVNFYVTDVDDENLQGTINEIDGDGDDGGDVTTTESLLPQEIGQSQNEQTKQNDQDQKEQDEQQEITKDESEVVTKSQLIFDTTYSIFSIILKSSINT